MISDETAEHRDSFEECLYTPKSCHIGKLADWRSKVQGATMTFYVLYVVC